MMLLYLVVKPIGDDSVVPGSVSPSEFALKVKLKYGSDLKIKNVILEEQ